MAAVSVALLDRPPAQAPTVEEPLEFDTAPIGPNEFEIVTDTDTLVKACSCKSSSDNPY